jgi:hypothetical protein
MMKVLREEGHGGQTIAACSQERDLDWHAPISFAVDGGRGVAATRRIGGKHHSPPTDLVSHDECAADNGLYIE